MSCERLATFAACAEGRLGGALSVVGFVGIGGWGTTLIAVSPSMPRGHRMRLIRVLRHHPRYDDWSRTMMTRQSGKV